jgi:hypothetical protein
MEVRVEAARRVRIAWGGSMIDASKVARRRAVRGLSRRSRSTGRGRRRKRLE